MRERIEPVFREERSDKDGGEFEEKLASCKEWNDFVRFGAGFEMVHWGQISRGEFVI